MFNNHDTHNYEQFLLAIVYNGYHTCFFNEICNYKNNAIVLRHDVDFDCSLAYQMALLENQLKVKSTYFFLVSSEYYNIAYKTNYDYIQRIKDLGHKISIHFDPSGYNNFNEGLKSEVDYFQNLFNVNIEIISFHLPTSFIMEYDQPLINIEHSYQSKYCRDIKYFSDSTGIWRYGHPFNSTEFHEKKNLQILIHPIWWMLPANGLSNTDKLKLYYKTRISKLKNHYLFNRSLISKVYEQVL